MQKDYNPIIHHTEGYDTGMTLGDWFTGMAMQAIIDQTPNVAKSRVVEENIRLARQYADEYLQQRQAANAATELPPLPDLSLTKPPLYVKPEKEPAE